MAFDDAEVQEWLATRKQEALRIDPETAEVTWWYAQTMDPYGVDPDLPEEYKQIGRESFARRPDSDIWVWFGDLPDEAQNRLEKKHGRQLNWPAGLEPLFVLWNAPLGSLDSRSGDLAPPDLEADR